MKRIARPLEIPEFKKYREDNSNATWEQMRNDGIQNGREVYQKTSSTLFENQGSLCAYCELKIVPTNARVEHFHPKSDANGINWNLVWDNLMGVCCGGTVSFLEEPAFKKPPKKHMSCDSHKDQLIQKGKLSADCEGWIINPYDLLAHSNFFSVRASTGELVPNKAVCVSQPILAGNQHGTNVELVQATISVLNLNCSRLSDARKRVVDRLNSELQEARLSGEDRTTAERRITEQHLSSRWPEFFTVYRDTLSVGFEKYLVEIGYDG